MEEGWIFLNMTGAKGKMNYLLVNSKDWSVSKRETQLLHPHQTKIFFFSLHFNDSASINDKYC